MLAAKVTRAAILIFSIGCTLLALVACASARAPASPSPRGVAPTVTGAVGSPWVGSTIPRPTATPVATPSPTAQPPTPITASTRTTPADVARTPTPTDIFGDSPISFSDARHGCLGAIGQIACTSDGGHTWSDASLSARDPVVQVQMLKAAIGWSVTGTGRLLATTDGGQHWRDVGGVHQVRYVHFVDARHGWALVGDRLVVTPDGTTVKAGQLVATADGGTTWSAVGAVPRARGCFRGDARRLGAHHERSPAAHRQCREDLVGAADAALAGWRIVGQWNGRLADVRRRAARLASRRRGGVRLAISLPPISDGRWWPRLDDQPVRADGLWRPLLAA